MLEVAIPEESTVNYIANKSQTGGEIHNANPDQNKLGSTFHPNPNKPSSRIKKNINRNRCPNFFCLVFFVSLVYCI